MKVRRRGVVLGIAAVSVLTGGSLTAASPVPAAKSVVTYDAVTVNAPSLAELQRRTDLVKKVLNTATVPGALTSQQAKHLVAPPQPAAPPQLSANAVTGQPSTRTRPTLPRVPVAKPGTVHAFTSPANPANDNWFSDCLAEPGVGTVQGWSNRADLCRAGTFTFRKIVITNGVSEIKGTATTRFTESAGNYSNPATSVRSIWSIVRFDQFATTGDFNTDALRMTGDVVCVNGATCTQDGTEPPDDVAAWRAGPRDVYRVLTVPTGTGTDVIGFGEYQVYAALADDSTGEVVPNFAPADKIRCHTTTYLSARSGCIFPNSPTPTAGWLTASPNDPSGDGSSPQEANHIWTAYVYPGKTVPVYADKNVPGRPPLANQFPGEPITPSVLHRIANTNPQYNANHNTAVNVCVFFGGAGYAQNGLKQCDEFPFRSTAEGAARPPLPNHNYSALIIDAKDNSNGGVHINRFFNEWSVLTGDAFYVGVYSHYTP